MSAIFRETLRLHPPSPMRLVDSPEDTIIGDGKYLIPSGVSILVHVAVAMKDRKVWGEDVSHSDLNPISMTQ